MKIESLESITYSDLEPAPKRKSTEEVASFLKQFEDCLEHYDTSFPFTLLHYAFIFRRFNAVNMIRNALSQEEWKQALHFQGPQGCEWITPLVCAKWNLFYLYGYDSKNNTNLSEALEDMMDEIDHVDEVVEYTDIVDEKNHKNIFQIFWGSKQPLLDIEYYPKQEIASLQVENNGISLVMDEVGTGKTVSALYAIRNTVEECNRQKRHSCILIVCPYSKREDWQNDIRRQLGRYAHIVEQSDNGDMYLYELKKAFFKNSEEIIFISGQKGGGDGKGSNTELKNSVMKYSDRQKWDLVIIDEGHISFKNYWDISARKAMILTATPIVVNAPGRRVFEDYVKLLKRITGKRSINQSINPINVYYPGERDIFVNWFKEDMGIQSADRTIQFIPCKRAEQRHSLYYSICEEKGVLPALQYDQDDEYLFTKYNELFPDQNQKVIRNYKLDKLVDLLGRSNKSYIIFCEHKFVVKLIYTRLKNEYSDVVIAAKYGKNENHSGLENVQEGQLINTVIQALRNDRRVLFVTTGKTGGTGLNLGEFDGIIHYELPFTSIELEQRFGRVDRIDIKQDYKKRDMIFLLNECESNENDNEMNRMLYYCVNKIDVTCKYMPIRNTVLFYPDVIKRNRTWLRRSLLSQRNKEMLSEAHEKKVKAFRRKRKEYEAQIRKHSSYSLISAFDDSIYDIAQNALKSEKNPQIDDAFYALLSKYIKYWNLHEEELNEFDKEYREFCSLRKQVKNWLALMGLCELENEEDVFVGLDSTDDYDNQKIEHKEKSSDINEDEKRGAYSVQKQIDSYLKMIDNNDFDNLELKGFSADSIFCFVNGRIRRAKIEAYRRGKGWRERR